MTMFSRNGKCVFGEPVHDSQYENEFLVERNKQLVKENNELRSENEGLKRENKRLRDDIWAYEKNRKLMEKRHGSLRVLGGC